MRVAAPLVLCFLVMAGCLSANEEPSSGITPAAGASVTPEPSTDAPTAGAVGDASAADAQEASAAPTTTVLAWDGATASAMCVMPAQRCDIVQQPRSSWNEFTALGVPGRPIRASGTLTWEAATPATEELHIFVFSLDETGMPIDSTRITGPSPLAFDVDLSEWTGVEFAYSLHSHHEFQDTLIVETSQSFHMVTNILSLEPWHSDSR